MNEARSQDRMHGAKSGLEGIIGPIRDHVPQRDYRRRQEDRIEGRGRR